MKSNKIVEKFRNKIICGDCLEVMKEIPDNSIDTIITDPPYGLSNHSEEKIRETLKNWLNGKEDFIPGGKGFMGKSWDSFVPPPIVWRECFRVMKPGATILVFAGTRTYDLMTISLRLAGFEIKDTLMWLYGQGFPKATDISKQIDKMKRAKREIIGRNPNSRENCDKSNTLYESGTVGKTDYITEPATPEAKLWNGWKSHGLKPAWEPIIMAMKPNEGSYAENALKWGVAGLNIDGGRIAGSWNWGKTKTDFRGKNGLKESFKQTRVEEDIVSHPQRRFPANVILECICDEVIERKEKPERIGKKGGNKRSFGSWAGSTADAIGRWPADKKIVHTNPECPCYMLDKQSGIVKSGDWNGYKPKNPRGFAGQKIRQPIYWKGDSGGASRFFYVAKASKSERDMGLEGFEPQKVNDGRKTPIDNPFQRGETPRHNTHPTVKPLKLMEYLCILTKTPTGGIVLDPFAGSGTTCMAAKKVGRDFIGIEKEKEYCLIAEARINTIQKPLL
uniref:Site-specific DNA-methyltransferase n=1 Tax=Dictyoglomus turgidum TaxID=513050 RepID=A0A7C3WMF3_9BACT